MRERSSPSPGPQSRRPQHPVEVLECGALLEACGEEPSLERPVIPALDFVSEDEGEERGVVEPLGTSQCER